jgi:hypothetical protein
MIKRTSTVRRRGLTAYKVHELLMGEERKRRRRARRRVGGACYVVVEVTDDVALMEFLYRAARKMIAIKTASGWSVEDEDFLLHNRGGECPLLAL